MCHISSPRPNLRVEATIWIIWPHYSNFVGPELFNSIYTWEFLHDLVKFMICWEEKDVWKEVVSKSWKKLNNDYWMMKRGMWSWSLLLRIIMLYNNNNILLQISDFKLRLLFCCGYIFFIKGVNNQFCLNLKGYSLII